MRSKKVEFRMLWPLYDEAEKIAKADGFRTVGHFITALVIRRMMERKRRLMSKVVASARISEQDDFVACLLQFPGDEAALLKWLRKQCREARKQVTSKRGRVLRRSGARSASRTRGSVR